MQALCHGQKESVLLPACQSGPQPTKATGFLATFLLYLRHLWYFSGLMLWLILGTDHCTVRGFWYKAIFVNEHELEQHGRPVDGAIKQGSLEQTNDRTPGCPFLWSRHFVKVF